MIVYDALTHQRLGSDDPNIAVTQTLTTILLLSKAEEVQLGGHTWSIAATPLMPKGCVDLVSSDGTRYRITNIGDP